MKKLSLLFVSFLLAFISYSQNVTLFEDFESGVQNNTVSIQGWQNIPSEGTRTFIYKMYDSNLYAQATAYGTTNTDLSNVIWLITPAINATATTQLSFKTAYGFYVHEPAYVGVSTNFVSDPTAATWTEITYAKPQGDSNGYTNLQAGGSGTIDLGSYNGQTIYIGFRYTGNKPDNKTTTWQVDDINVTGILGFDLNLSSNKISVYPNPASDYIVVNTFEKGKVQIYNALGVKVLGTEDQTINIKNLQNGLYFVAMENDGQKYVAKFLKK